MKFTECDAVVLLKDHEEEGIQRGDIGVIVMAYTEPKEAYEVEFADENGGAVAQIALPPDEMEKYSG